MNYESVRVPYRCPDCAARQQLLHALTLVSDGVRASSSFQCTRCGSAFEADDRGVPMAFLQRELQSTGAVLEVAAYRDSGRA
ncbi:MAG TPA: hypothetical protein VE153_13520 [Myxococcus sp.]|nr:hypothetical protein [Myxococcus sp.]